MPSQDNAGRASLHTPLFDRFESDRPADFNSLARDIADILGARRATAGPTPGLLAWGLPGIGSFSPVSEEDRQRVAALIAAAITRYEPRLSGVRVTPEEVSGDFAFAVSADLIQAGGPSINLRIFAPRRGGALGANIVMLGSRR